MNLSLVTLALSAACVWIGGCSPAEQETRYKTLTAAQIAGAVDRGWVPGWLPRNAFNLKEKHDPDTNRSLLRFNFPSSDKWDPASACARIAPDRVRGPALKASWWPADVAAAATKRHVYYVCAGATEFMAVDFDGGEAFHWRP